MTRCSRIRKKLDALKPHYLEIIDESHLHDGHIQFPAFSAYDNKILQETHIRLKIAADSLKNLSLINQHKLINQILSDEFKCGLHALSIKIYNKK